MGGPTLEVDGNRSHFIIAVRTDVPDESKPGIPVTREVLLGVFCLVSMILKLKKPSTVTEGW